MHRRRRQHDVTRLLQAPGRWLGGQGPAVAATGSTASWTASECAVDIAQAAACATTQDWLRELCGSGRRPAAMALEAE